jgi:flagellar protein FlgJ
MTPKEFVHKYYPYAKEVEKETEIPAIAILAQAALESGWGRSAIGNNIFGIKYKKGDWKYQEVLTTEYSSKPDAFKGQKIKSIIFDTKTKKYKYKIWQYFADYPTPKEAFLKHAELLLSKRYEPALRWKNNPKRYLIAVWRAGYATDWEYGYIVNGGYCKVNGKKYYSIVNSILKRLP